MRDGAGLNWGRSMGRSEEEVTGHICVWRVHACGYIYVLGKGKTLYAHWTVSLFIEIIASTDTQQFCCCAPSFHGSKQADCEGPCTRMFIAALFIILRNWKQPKCPSIRNWLTKWWSHATIKWCCGSIFLNRAVYIYRVKERKNLRAAFSCYPFALVLRDLKARQGWVYSFSLCVTFCLILLDNRFVSLSVKKDHGLFLLPCSP